MARMRFGTFCTPHHPIGEHPLLMFRRDLALATHVDKLGFDEFWVGEHHSTGWELIGSPELFLSAVSQVTSQIKLGTGVISIPYHHPFMVAQRLVELDWISGGRVIFGSGPGALQSDARMFGIEAIVQRPRQDEALGVILRLLKGEERVTHESEWFTLRDAKLQLLPLQENMPIVTASSVSPSGMRMAGKYGTGVISVASTSDEGIQALATQWSFAEEAAQQHGQTVDRKDWRVLFAWHLAETKQRAEDEVSKGLLRWNNEHKTGILGLPGAQAYDNPRNLLDAVSGGDALSTTIIGTPDEMVDAIRKVQALAGGFGTVIGFAHDWADREATLRSWELFARYVIPEINGYTRSLQESANYASARKVEYIAAHTNAIMSLIHEDKRAAEAMEITARQQAEGVKDVAFRPATPDFTKR